MPSRTASSTRSAWFSATLRRLTVVPDGTAARPRTRSSTFPPPVRGCLLPHAWLADGRSVYDALGAGFTLLALPGVDGSPAAAAVTAVRRRATTSP